MNKKGQLYKSKIFWIVLILIIGYIILLFSIGGKCTISENEVLKAEGGNYIYKISNWIKETVFYCNLDNSLVVKSTFIHKIKNFLSDKLGFDQTVYEFFYPRLTMGFFIGLWIYLSYLLSKLTIKWNLLRLINVIKKDEEGDKFVDSEMVELSSSWLGFLGSSLWKIVPIAVFYAVLMQIPILNTFIETITFKPLGVHWIVRSFILAFYLGLFPGAIESYTRYRLRMKYYNQILRVKYGVKIAKKFAEG